VRPLEAALAAWQSGQPSPQRVHIALAVPDIRLYEVLKKRAMVVQPPYQNVHVELHIIYDDGKGIEPTIRVALVQSGLVSPEQAQLTYPDQVTLGWPTEKAA
jgi:hypothetical protein